MLLILKGMMGVGKIALSRTLGKRLGWPVVDKDDFSDVLMAHVENYGPLAYASMFSVAESLLTQGFSVICDSPLRGEVGYLRANELAQKSGSSLRVVTCSLSDKTLGKQGSRPASGDPPTFSKLGTICSATEPKLMPTLVTRWPRQFSSQTWRPARKLGEARYRVA